MNEQLARQAAVAMMNLINVKCNTGSVTIPGRPEMRLGYPVYIRYRDSFHYVKSISHTFDYGGTFSTTLGLEMERRKIYSLMNKDTGQWEGKKHPLIYKFREGANIDIPPDKISRRADQQSPNEAVKERISQAQGQSTSLVIGRYDIIPQEDTKQITITNNSTPLTDEGGYRVVGAFPYGRLMNPRVIDDESLTYQYSNENFKITSMFVGSLNESSKMSLSFVKDREGAVPRYLLSQVISATGQDKPSNSSLPNDNQTPDQTVTAEKTTTPIPISMSDPTFINPANVSVEDYPTLMARLQAEENTLKTLLANQQAKAKKK
jgi:hypothetical protein